MQMKVTNLVPGALCIAHTPSAATTPEKSFLSGRLQPSWDDYRLQPHTTLIITNQECTTKLRSPHIVNVVRKRLSFITAITRTATILMV